MRTLEETAVGEEGTRKELKELVRVANGCPSTFDETSMFIGQEAEVRLPIPLRRSKEGELMKDERGIPDFEN